MLSWFGAVRMKRKNLWLEEQRHLVRFHTHQNQAQHFISGPHTVKLPSEEQIPTIPMDQSIREIAKTADTSQGDTTKQPNAPGTTPITSGCQGGGVAGQGEPVHMQPYIGANQASSRGGGGGGTGRGVAIDGGTGIGSRTVGRGGHGQMPPRAPYRIDSMQYRMHSNRPVMTQMRSQQQLRDCLQNIKDQNIGHSGSGIHPMYTGEMVVSRGAGPMPNYSLQVMQQRHIAQQQKLQYMRMLQQQQQQQQHQHQQMHQHQMMGHQQYGQYRAGPGHPAQMMHPAVATQPMHAHPPIQMQQVIQQRQQVAYAPGPQPGGHVGMMGGPQPQTVMAPGDQPGMQQYPQQQAPPGLFM